MSLQDELDALRAEFVRSAPPDTGYPFLCWVMQLLQEGIAGILRQR
jgi:hypothetical protein